MSRGSTPRQAQTAGDLGLAVQFNAETPVAFRTAPLSSGRIVPRGTIGIVTPLIPQERLNVKHSVAGFLRLPLPTSEPALMRVLHCRRR